MHRNKSAKKPEEDVELARVFASITDEKTMRRFFGEIFTRAELDDIVLRWKLMNLLRAGVPQRKIAADLGISLCKITRGAKIVKNRNSITNRYIQPSESRRFHGQ
jgi:TrpR family transcriptional regulator, trp operon repressor